MLRLIEARTPAQLCAIRTLYLSAFPQNERKPFSAMVNRRNKGLMELLCVVDETDQFLGLVITVLHKDIVLLDYFAVSPAHRGQGVGAHALELVRNRHPDRRLVLEIEDPDIPCNNREERLRRRAFYLKNGLAVMPFRSRLFGVEMCVLTAGGAVTFAEYHEVYTAVFSAFIGRFIKQI